MLAEATSNLVLAWSVQALGALSPGPSVAFVLGLATTKGRAFALGGALGIACGSIALASATVLGVTVVLAQSDTVLSAIRHIGAGYLFWLSWKALRRTFGPRAASAIIQAPNTWLGTVLIQGAALQLSNPKAVLFWLSIASISGIIDAPANTAILFVLGAFLVSFLYHGAYAIVGSSAQMCRMTARLEHVVGIALAFAFAGAGLQLLMSGK